MARVQQILPVSRRFEPRLRRAETDLPRDSGGGVRTGVDEGTRADGLQYVDTKDYVGEVKLGVKNVPYSHGSGWTPAARYELCKCVAMRIGYSTSKTDSPVPTASIDNCIRAYAQPPFCQVLRACKTGYYWPIRPFL